MVLLYTTGGKTYVVYHMEMWSFECVYETLKVMKSLGAPSVPLEEISKDLESQGNYHNKKNVCGIQRTKRKGSLQRVEGLANIEKYFRRN